MSLDEGEDSYRFHTIVFWEQVTTLSSSSCTPAIPALTHPSLYVHEKEAPSRFSSYNCGVSYTMPVPSALTTNISLSPSCAHAPTMIDKSSSPSPDELPSSSLQDVKGIQADIHKINTATKRKSLENIITNSCASQSLLWLFILVG